MLSHVFRVTLCMRLMENTLPSSSLASTRSHLMWLWWPQVSTCVQEHWENIVTGSVCWADLYSATYIINYRYFLGYLNYCILYAYPPNPPPNFSPPPTFSPLLPPPFVLPPHPPLPHPTQHVQCMALSLWFGKVSNVILQYAIGERGLFCSVISVYTTTQKCKYIVCFMFELLSSFLLLWLLCTFMLVQLVVNVYDSSRENRRDTLVCTITVLRNQNPPRWVDAPYSFSISEDRPYISNIGNVTAVDIDPEVSTTLFSFQM